LSSAASISRRKTISAAFRAHHRDLSRWPRHDPVRAQIFAAHGNIGATVCLTQNYRNLGHRSRRVSKEQLGAVTDDAAALLLHAGQKARYIDESQQRNIEGVAEADKPG